MSIARRAFLQFTAGAVGGTLLSPLPWKLADDSAIWSQNWSWRPSPERGPISRTPSICTLCDGACGIQARLVSKERAILIEGNPDHPINQGGICPLGAAGLQFLYATYRIPQPMKQTKKRGDMSGFQKISWEEALNELGGKLLRLRTEGKPNALACITTKRPSSMDDLWQQFFKAYGSANLFRMPSHADSLRLASLVVTGQDRPIAFALENATYVLSFGANLIDGWGSPCRMQAAFRNWHEGTPAKLVQIESRCSLTASKADRWIAVAPGSESALALAISYVMIKENLFDSAFVGGNVFGFEDWTDTQGKTRKGFKNLVLSLYAPEQVAQQTGVDPARIRELAREFAAQKNAVAVWGNTSDMPNNIYADLSFLALNILKGNLASGGMINLAPPIPLGPLPDVQPDSIAQKGLAQNRVDFAASKPAPLAGNNLYAFLDMVAKGASSYPIDLLMVHEANPAYSLAENQLFQNALTRIGTLVSFSSYMDETALQADLILPNPMALERLDDVVGIGDAPYGYYAVVSPILPPQQETKHTGDVVIQLGKSLGGGVAAALPWESYEAFLQERVNGLAASKRGAVADSKDVHPWELPPSQPPDVNYRDGADLWTKLTAGLCWYDAPMDLLQNIKTPSGKLELALQTLQERGMVVAEDQVYLPHFAPLIPSGAEQEYPLQLVTYKVPAISTEYHPTPPFMTKLIWDSILKGSNLFVELHPQTARSLGFAEGDGAFLKTPQGELPVRIHMFPGARPGVVYMVEGLGHKAYDQYIANKGVNAKDLIEVQMDPVTGLGTVWTTRAQLRRA